MEFEPTRSFAYRFSRYEILPELQQLREVQSGDPFRLRDLAWPLIDRHLTPERQSIRLKKARSDTEETMGQVIRFYVPFLAKELGVFINLGNGYFRNQTEVDVSDDDLADAAIEAGDEASVARMSEAISGTNFGPIPHVAALMRATSAVAMDGLASA